MTSKKPHPKKSLRSPFEFRSYRGRSRIGAHNVSEMRSPDEGLFSVVERPSDSQVLKLKPGLFVNEVNAEHGLDRKRREFAFDAGA